MLEFSDASVLEAGQAFRRIEGFIARALEFLGTELGQVVASRPAAFDAAMDDDLSVAEGCAVLHDCVRVGNAAIAGQDRASVADSLADVLGMLDVLGLHPSDWQAVGDDAGRTTAIIDELVQALLDQRQEARARKDFGAADAIRDALDAMGVRIEDTPTGARWTLDHSPTQGA